MTRRDTEDERSGWWLLFGEEKMDKMTLTDDFCQLSLLAPLAAEANELQLSAL